MPSNRFSTANTGFNGYEQHPFFEFTQEELQGGIVVLPLQESEPEKTFLTNAMTLLGDTEFLFVEFFLFLSIALEIVFCISLGIAFVYPFLLISLINCFLWIMHQHTIQKQ